MDWLPITDYGDLKSNIKEKPINSFQEYSKDQEALKDTIYKTLNHLSL